MFITRVLKKNANLETLFNIIWQLCYCTVSKLLSFDFPPRKILVDIKIMFLSQLGDKLWRKTEVKKLAVKFFLLKKNVKNDHFFRFSP